MAGVPSTELFMFNVGAADATLFVETWAVFAPTCVFAPWSRNAIDAGIPPATSTKPVLAAPPSFTNIVVGFATDEPMVIIPFDAASVRRFTPTCGFATVPPKMDKFSPPFPPMIHWAVDAPVSTNVIISGTAADDPIWSVFVTPVLSDPAITPTWADVIVIPIPFVAGVVTNSSRTKSPLLMAVKPAVFPLPKVTLLLIVSNIATSASVPSSLPFEIFIWPPPTRFPGE